MKWLRGWWLIKKNMGHSPYDTDCPCKTIAFDKISYTFIYIALGLLEYYAELDQTHHFISLATNCRVNSSSFYRNGRRQLV